MEGSGRIVEVEGVVEGNVVVEIKFLVCVFSIVDRMDS